VAFANFWGSIDRICADLALKQSFGGNSYPL